MRVLTNRALSRRLLAARNEGDEFARAQTERQSDRAERYKVLVEHLYDLHNHPKASEWDLKLGNDPSSVRWFCSECSRQWPCPAWTDIRAAVGYGGGEFALLALVKKAPVDEPAKDVA